MRATLVLAASAAALVPIAASASETVTYGYDAKGRLVAVSHAGSVNNGLTATYAYDAADNRTSTSTVVPTGSTSSRVVVVPLGRLTIIPIN